MKIRNLRKIRKSIVRSDKLIENGLPTTLDEDTAETINCYAYAFGIMYNGVRYVHFSPGYTEYQKYMGISGLELMRKTEVDLNNLKIPYRKIMVEEEVKLQPNEYLVKVFYASRSEILPKGDFHFIRQDPKTEKWFHKVGWYDQPVLVTQSNDYKKERVGTEPDQLIVRDDSCRYTIYQPVCYYAITEI